MLYNCNVKLNIGDNIIKMFVGNISVSCNFLLINMTCNITLLYCGYIHI